MRKIILTAFMALGGIALAQETEKSNPSVEKSNPSVEKSNPSVEKSNPSVEKSNPSVEKSNPSVEKSNPIATQNDSVVHRLNSIESKTKKFNAFLNYQLSFEGDIKKDQDVQAGFKAQRLRLEFKGVLNEELGYRFRQRLNKEATGQSFDGLAKATDLMYITYKVSDRFVTTIGKQCQVWGGMEYATSIYQYSDFINNMDIFMLGLNFNYKLGDSNDFNVQITDSRNTKFVDTFGVVDGVKASNIPLAYILNWNSSFGEGVFKTCWAVGLESQAEDKYSRMVTLGNNLNLSKFQFTFDYMLAQQDLDRLGYASSAAKVKLAQDVTYNSFIAKANFKPTDQWDVFAKYMYETADIKSFDKDNFRKSQGCFLGIEHKPFADQDLKLFLTYVGIAYDILGVKTNKNRVNLGMMYRINVF